MPRLEWRTLSGSTAVTSWPLFFHCLSQLKVYSIFCLCIALPHYGSDRPGRWDLYLSGYRTRRDNCHWRSIRSALWPPKYCPLCNYEYMARNVSVIVHLYRCWSANYIQNKKKNFRCALLYLGIMVYIVLRILNETKPMWYYILAACLFILSQLAWLLLGRVICKVEKSLPHSFFLQSEDLTSLK